MEYSQKNIEAYLLGEYEDELLELINRPGAFNHESFYVDLKLLRQKQPDWFHMVTASVHAEVAQWDDALRNAQKQTASNAEDFLEDGSCVKSLCHVRFVGLPPPDGNVQLPFPNYSQIGQFRQIRANVVRMTQARLLEERRNFVCARCKHVITIDADYSLMYRFDVPRSCEQGGCNGSLQQQSETPDAEHCVSYQELRVQDISSERNVPPSITVTLDRDLVDSCQPGDCVTICGSIERRWKSFQYEGKVEACIAMRAISVARDHHNLAVDTTGFSEQFALTKAEWMESVRQHGEGKMRDILLRSICPEVYGLYPVKLGVALAICSGNLDAHDGAGPSHRGNSHVLMIGDPGLAKSKILMSVAAIAPRSVLTTGMGCSSAGLTAAAIKEDGEWQLEAGALVLSDGGVCCIDEFNLMRETDRTSIHEAMEQQTISMAKAGIVCKLNTRCAIIAAANPRNLYRMSEPEGTSSVNIGIGSPLLSRFDLVFILRDERVPEWDAIIAEHLLSQARADFAGFAVRSGADLWSNDKLQSHFASICHVKPKMSKSASDVIAKYFQRCREDAQRDFARTTVRLLDSLNRLAEAYARLVFRDQVTVADALSVIRLMESTHGFGRIIKPFDVIKEELPLDFAADELREVLNIFDPDGEISLPADNYIPHEPLPQDTQTSQVVPSTGRQFDDQRHGRTSPTLDRNQTVPQNSLLSPEYTSTANLEFEILQALSTSSTPQSATETIPAMDDEEDLLLSQVADEFQASTSTQAHDQQAPRVRETGTNAWLSLNASAVPPHSQHSSSFNEDSVFQSTQGQSTGHFSSANVFRRPLQKTQTDNSEDSGIGSLPTFEQVKAFSQLLPPSNSQAVTQQEEQDILDCLDL